MQIEEILIIQNAQESYGISTEDINQISRVPSLMPLPLRPSGVRGLCSVGGNVVSMVDMNLLLGMPLVDLDAPASRIISLNDEYSSNTLLVSDVYNTVEIKQDKIEYIEKQDDPIVAIYKYKDMLVQVLSLQELFQKIKKVDIPAKEVNTGKVKYEVAKEEDTTRFLIFSMSKERYGLEIEYLQEIILADTTYTEIAGSPKEVMGLITLRDELLMVVDLRVHYGFKPTKNDTNRILVVSYENKKIGLCIDSIIDIKNFNNKNIEYMNDRMQESKIAGVIHDEDYLVSFFDDVVLKEIFDNNDAFLDDEEIQVTDESTENISMEVIVFKLATKEYAFEVEQVDEIIDVVKSTDIAFSDESVDGIINIRGQIVTIVSLFSKLNIDTVINDDSKIIICNINDTRIGFVVDSVSDILNVSEDEVREEQDSYFDKILHLDNGERLVLCMDINKIVMGDD